MADFQYMVIGVTKAETGSMDAYFDVRIDNGNYDYAYLGCPTSSAPGFPPPTWFTWNTGSLADPTQNDLQMYTPYPAGGITRGKLYWVGTGSFETDYAGIPNNNGFVNLEIPGAGRYYIITPSLSDPTFQSSGKFTIAQYAFADENDLWNNGWKSQRGSPIGESNPLATQTNWINTVGDNSWVGPPFNFDPTGGTPGDRAQIVANVLALTTNSATIQNSLGINPLIKGAIVLAGRTTPFDNNTYRNLVPLKN
jgi:hypothetical protein